MGVFQKIRDKSILTGILIGGALLLFVLGDYLTSNKSVSSGDDFIGKVDGTEISLKEYDSFLGSLLYLNNNPNTAGSLSDEEKQNYSSQTWNQLVMQKIFDEEASSNGVNVSDSEIEEMLAGKNPYPFYVYRLFGGPENYEQIKGKLSENVENFAEYSSVRNFQEAELLKTFGVNLRKQEKLMSLIKNSFFTTKSEALNEYQAKYSTKTVTVAQVPYYLIPDSLVTVTDKDLKDYYNKNKGKYKVNQSNKKIIYAMYRVDPSADDETETNKWAQETFKLFGEESNDELFVKTESETSFEPKFFKKGAGLAPELDSVLFAHEKGYVFGPYTSFRDANKTYNVAKIIDVQMMPDSAKVSQVLLTPEKMIQALTKNNPKPSKEQVIALWKNFDKKVDSVYNALNKDLSLFPMAAVKFSDDTASSKKGGDLGWIQESSTQYPPEFLDSVFMENKSQTTVKKIKVLIQNGQYYYYQLVKVDQMGPKSKKLKVGVVSKSVLPGSKTRDGYFNKINQVAIELNTGKKLKELKDKFAFLIDSASVEPQQFLVNDIKGGRQLVYWAFNEVEGTESKVFDFDRKYIVAYVAETIDKGYKNWDDVSVKPELEMKVKNLKKAEYIATKLGAIDAKKLMGIATLISGATTEVFPDVNLKNGVAKLAYESALTGAIGGVAKGKVSPLIQGLNAVYIVKVDSEKLATVNAKTNFDIEKQEINSKNNKFESLMQELITEKANIEDNRKILQ